MILGVAAHDILAWLLAIFFAVGAVGNWRATAKVRADYVRWGYPGGFHRFTAVLEAAVAILLVFGATRLFGTVLGAAIMLAAIATLLRHKEYKHALLPTAVLLLLILLGFLVV